MVEPILKVDGLAIAAGAPGKADHVIVDNVSFEIGAGQSIGLIGESGSGKSTIGLALLGHFRPGLRPVAGAIKFNGQDILKLSAADRRALRGNRISYVAQSAAAAFNPAHRLGEQVIEAIVGKRQLDRRQALERAEELFALLGLPDPAKFLQRYPHQASGGQLQRIMTAMALCPHPDLIVFDEPTTALDVTTQAEVLLAIRRAVAATHVSALFISHDLPVVAQIADRILVLQQGRTVEIGETEAILNRPREDYTRRLIAARSLPTQTDPGDAVEPVLDIVDVSANYRNARNVLDRVSLSLPAGRTLAVVGQSGSGKTTLGRVVIGAHPLAAGRIRFRGAPLANTLAQRHPEHTRRIQMIHQIPEMALNPRQRLKDIIGRPLTLFRGLKGGELADAVAELMAAVDLDPGLGTRFPGAVSGGQKQRVCIARALAADPEIIICDEPTSALDPIIARSVLELLARLQQTRGLSLLFITHDFNVVKAVAHDVAVLDAGRVVCAGPANEVLTQPFDPRIGRLLRAVPELDPNWLNRWSESDGARDRPLASGVDRQYRLIEPEEVQVGA